MRVLLISIPLLLLISCSKTEIPIYLRCETHVKDIPEIQQTLNFKIENKLVSENSHLFIKDIPVKISREQYQFKIMLDGQNLENKQKNRFETIYQINRLTGDFQSTTYHYINSQHLVTSNTIGICKKINI